MKHRALFATIVLAGSSALLAINVIGREPAVAQGQAPPAKDHFLEVGKSYTIGYSTGKRAGKCKVLEEPRGHWVKVQVSEGATSVMSWINLDAVGFINIEAE